MKCSSVEFVCEVGGLIHISHNNKDSLIEVGVQTIFFFSIKTLIEVLGSATNYFPTFDSVFSLPFQYKSLETRFFSLIS